MTTTTGKHTEAIEAGMAWLDDRVPGWERDIDLATLDLRDCGLCVVGQVVAKRFDQDPWTTAIAGAELIDKAIWDTYESMWPHELGFSLEDDDDPDPRHPGYAEAYEAWIGRWARLTQEWADAIRSRLDR